MPHRLSSIGLIDIIDNDCTFAIPALNDATRTLEKFVYNVASFKSDKPYKPGTPVFLHGRKEESWTVKSTPTESEGFAGIVVENNISQGAATVQLTGSAWVSFPTDAANLEKYLLYDGSIDDGTADVTHIVGKITAIISPSIYEVLLHSLPRPEEQEAKVVEGIPFSAGSKAVVTGDDNMLYAAHTIELAWDGADSGQGFSITNGTVTPTLGGTGATGVLTFEKTYVTGAATVSTWDHQAVPKDPTPADTLAVSCKLEGNTLTIYAPPNKTFNNYGPFKMRVNISGWMK